MTPDERAILRKLKEAALEAADTLSCAWINCDMDEPMGTANENAVKAFADTQDSLLDDIEYLERSKRILEGDYNKLHDELISAESDAREAVKTRDRLLARCERLETALRFYADAAIYSDLANEELDSSGRYLRSLDSTAEADAGARAREALAATDKEPTDET